MGDYRNAAHQIQEGDLIAYMEGNASPAVSAHIAGCPLCAAEVEALREVDLSLAIAHARADCPHPDVLLEYQAKLLTKPEQRRIKTHIAACPDCRLEMEQLAVASPPMSSAPAGLRSRTQEALRTILAVLQEPSRSQPAMAVRGAPVSHSEYHAQGYVIRLGILAPQAGEQAWQIEGMLTRRGGDLPPPNAASVQLLQDGQPIAEDIVDDLGYFALERIRPGKYTLQIDRDQIRVLIADLLIS